MKNDLKNYLWAVLLACLFLGCAKQPSLDEKTDAEAAIKGFYAALEKQDYQHLKAFCTPDFKGFEDGSTINSIDEFISFVKSFEFNSMQFNMDFVSTDVTKEMANSIVKFDAHFKGPKGNMNLKTFENYVLKKIDGKWLISFYQCSFLNNPPSLQKGSVLGFHTLTGLELKPGVTMAQVEAFLNDKYAPAFNEAGLDMKVIPLKGLRGDAKDQYGMIMFLNSDEVRNAIWSAEGTLTPKGEEMFKKIQSLNDERDKLFIFKTDPYTDWQVQ